MKSLLMCCFAISCLASTENTSEKFYVDPEQVYVGNEGILINLLGNLYPVNGLFRNSRGLHVMVNEIMDERIGYTCPLGHPSLDGSGMCSNSDCPFRKR